MLIDVEFVFEDEISHLFDLIRFRLISEGLQVDYLFDVWLVEDGVAAFARFSGEARVFQEVAEVGEGDVRV